MGWRRNHTDYANGYSRLQYCSWAHGGVPSAEVNNTLQSRQETTLRRKRQKDVIQYVRSDVGPDPNSNLCAFCSTIDWERIFGLNAADLSDHGLAVICLERITPDMTSSKCPCCAMLASMAFGVEESVPADKRSDRAEYHLRVFPITCLWGVRTSSGQTVSLFVSVVREGDTESFPFPQSGTMGVPLDLDHSLLEDSWRRGLIVPTTATVATRSDQGVVCHAVSADVGIDYQRVTALVAECSDHHLECAKYVVGSFPKGARVIDCATREIVDLTPGMKYLALSYVWGETSADRTLQNPSGNVRRLTGTLPKTIEDALIVTQKLGFSYLWLDRYCIQQHNNAEKKDQIQQMASIYSYATATICATGTDSASGLCGVSEVRRPQMQFKSRGLVLARCPWPEHHLRDHLVKSKWSTRGWTYQEPLLSKICLFFTPETVVQVCHTRTFAEALAVEYQGSTCFTNRTVVLSSSLFMPHLPMCMSAIQARKQLAFSQSVHQYQKRTFSYDSDALDAFKGFLSIVDMKSYWGVPVLRIERDHSAKEAKPEQNDLTTGFIFGMLWHTLSRQDHWGVGHVHASNEFPSWSWVAQKAVLTDFLHHAGVLKSARIRAAQLTYRDELVMHCARLQLESCQGKLMHPNELLLHHARYIPEQSRYVSVTGVTARWKLTQTRYGNRTTGKLRGTYFPCVDLDEVSDAALQPHLAQMSLAGPARIAFDQGYALDPSTDLTQHIGSPAQQGVAVLMLVTRWVGKLVGRYTYWLAVRQEQDGTYRREGMIECHFEEQVTYTNMYQPPDEALTTFRLG